jgi:hypothetical protein
MTIQASMRSTSPGIEVSAGPLSADPTLVRNAAVQVVFLDITGTFEISFVPDLFDGMSTRPAYLEAAWELCKEDLDLERLDRRTKLIIALAFTTNDAGVYFIAASPHAFGLNALDHATYDKVLSTIRFFKAFDRYLSGIMPASVRETTHCITTCLRDEYRCYEASRACRSGPSLGEREEATAWALVILLFCGILLPIAAGVYLLLG